MQYWWVNQNQTYAQEVGGGYLWSPKQKANGQRNRFYDSMTEARPGDVIFSFADTYIKAIGIVIGACQSAPKPTEFGAIGSQWSAEGWYLPVRFTELDAFIRPRDHMERIAPTLPTRYSPIQADGRGNQGTYLAPIDIPMALVLKELLTGQVENIIAGAISEYDIEGDVAAEDIRNDETIPVTFREQLVRARVGQGLFRSRVEMLEAGCRITGIRDRKFLRASHIKPWAQSDSYEKLDGNNGLLLAPNADHLFDKGFISFTSGGTLLCSKFLPSEIKVALGITDLTAPLSLTSSQEVYMAFHREHIFLH